MRRTDAQGFDSLLEPILDAVRDYSYWDAAAKTSGFSAIRALSPEDQSRFVLHCLTLAAPLREAADEISTNGSYKEVQWAEKNRRLYRWWGAVSCALVLLKRKLPWSEEELESLVSLSAARGALGFGGRTLSGIVSQLEANVEPVRANRRMAKLIDQLLKAYGQYQDPDYRRMVTRLSTVLGRTAADQIKRGEAWSDRAIVDLLGLEQHPRAAWEHLIGLAAESTGSTPSAKWVKNTSECVGAIGKDHFVATVVPWFELVDKPRTLEARPAHQWAPDPTHLIDDTHADILKGLCWIAGTIESPDLARALGRLALSCYRKVPGIGPRAAKIGNAAVYALGRMPGRDSLAQLAMLRVKVKFGTAQKMLEKALAAAAEREGLPREEIDELAVPAYGLTAVGLREEPLAEFTAVLRVARSGKCELTFRKEDGKSQKSVPASLKEPHAADLKDLKAAAKDIGAMLPAQRDRLDSLFLQNKSWSLAAWRERYLDHPLIGVLARRLIWRFAPGKRDAWDAEAPARAAIWLDERGLTGLGGEPIELDEPHDRVHLWHPIEAPQPEILAWREFLEAREIVQPFKQAHREVYLLTDAERATGVYSNRYAAHILRQHQFNALCGARNWKNKLRLMVDDEYPPATRFLPVWGVRAEFWVEGAGEEHGTDTNESGVFNHIATDQVRFYRAQAATNTAHAGGGPYATHILRGTGDDPIPLDSIPALVFSEIMRDVDLFVGVASVGNNPAWQDGGPDGAHRDYWWAYSFGDLSATAETRRDILSRLVPRLKIADRCSLDGKFLRVRGDLRTYKIHLGSGNILMEPDDQYLCIVPGRSDPALPQKLYLPFEGDRTLAIIVSKAFLLADDKSISDTSITSQIRRK